MKPWLSRFCHEAPVRHGWMGRVNAVGRWSVACEGRVIVAVEDGGAMEYPPASADPDLAERAGCRLGPYLGNFAPPALTTTLRCLWLWCEGVRWLWCEWCVGTGWDRGHESNGTCPDCDRGRSLPAPAAAEAMGRLAGLAVDRSRLAWTLAPELGDGDAPVRIATLGGAAYLDGPDWRVVLMGLDALVVGDRVLPTFHPEPVFAELWLDREDPGGRMALSDWLNERGDPYHLALTPG